MSLELDHIFIIVQKDFPEKAQIPEHLPIGNFRAHAGQGTMAEFLAFEKNYLEFIWLADAQEASTNPLELNRRFQAGQCPFGIAFRGSLPQELLSSFWMYNPEYMPQGCIWIHKSHKENFSLPMIFVIDLPLANKELWPSTSTRWKKSEILPGSFEKVTVTGPFESINLSLPNLEMKKSSEYHLSIEGVGAIDLKPLPCRGVSKKNTVDSIGLIEWFYTHLRNRRGARS